MHGWTGPSRFGLDAKPCLMGRVTRSIVIGIHQHFAKRLAVTEQEPVSDLVVFNPAAEHGRQVWFHVVATPLSELVDKRRGPYRSFYLVAGKIQIREAAALQIIT